MSEHALNASIQRQIFLEGAPGPNSGDSGDSGLRVGLSLKKVKITLDGKSSAGKGNRPPRSESAGSSDPITNF